MDAIDWSTVWRPCVYLMLSGQSPYQNAWFFGPPWALFPLIPLALLPEPIGRILLLLMCLGAFAFAAVRLGANTVCLLAFLLSPVVLFSLYVGNLDGLVLLGAVMPHWIGLFFLSIKPQIGFVLALYWFIDDWRTGGPRQIARTFAPISIALLLSLALYGLWPLRVITADGPLRPNNVSLMPLTLSVGLALAIAALRLRKSNLALAAGPILSPYVSFQSFSASLVPLFRYPPELIVVVISLWLMAFISR